MKNYEAWDNETDFCIYSGAHESALIQEIRDYIEYQNHIDEALITDDQIRNLDRAALKKVGIQIYVNA